MRRAIEKLSFLLLSLATASLLSFVLLARLTDLRSPEASRFPLLVNPEPRNVQGLTRAALARVAAGGADAPAASAELVRLGGAAFPHVLPALDSLEPSARGRVALALAPVAVRMGVAEEENFGNADRAVAFFARFWQDRSADFRSAAVRRKVARLAERALSLRKKEVVELDTFALEELFAALGSVRNDADVQRAARLTPVLAHVTGMPWTVEPETPRAQAAATVTRWRDWAIEHAADYATLDGPSRLQAMVIQTRYFRWLSSLPRAVSRDDELLSRKLDSALTAARSTLPVAGFALALGLALAAAIARRRDHLWRRFRGISALALLLAAAPIAVLAVRAASAGLVALIGVLAVSVAATATVELGVAAPARGRFRQAFERAGVLLPPLLAATLAGEAWLGRGLGALSVRALSSGDLPTLMWIAFTLSASGALTWAVLGIVLPSRPPREQPLRELGRPLRRKPLLAAAAVLLAAVPLGTLVASWTSATAADATTLLVNTCTVVLASLAGATLIGLVLGLLAGGLSRTADVVLARGMELSAALPLPFVTAACFLLGSVPGAFALGALRGVELANVLRNRIHEQRAADEIEPDSLRNAPLAPYVRRLLPAALAPFMTMLALSIPWLFALEAASASLGARTAGTFASRAITSTPALLAVSAISLGLIVLARELTPREHVGTPVLALNRRIGTSSFPPPADPDSEMEGDRERDSVAEPTGENAGENAPEETGAARGDEETPREG